MESSATIYFSDGSTVVLHLGDKLTPIISVTKNDETFSTKKCAISIVQHIHDGIIPSIMDALCSCKFFYVGNDTSVVYCSKSIIRIESN